jgi:hypothetical protein
MRVCVRYLLTSGVMQVLIHNVMQISRSEETRQAHAFSLYFMQPLVATSLGLLAFNWWVAFFLYFAKPHLVSHTLMHFQIFDSEDTKSM